MNYRCCCLLVHAMNYSYCCAIVRSEETHTLATTYPATLPLLLRPRACNELQLLLRHRAVRKNTHAGEVICFDAITCNELPLHAMNYRCCCLLVHAMNYSYCCAIVRSKETHTLATTYPATLPLLLRPRACNELQLLLRHRAVRKNTHAGEVICFEAITCNELPLHAMNYRCCCVLVHAMNYSYCCAIVRSEKTHTLAKYVYASKRSRAMNYRCMQ